MSFRGEDIILEEEDLVCMRVRVLLCAHVLVVVVNVCGGGSWCNSGLCMCRIPYHMALKDWTFEDTMAQEKDYTITIECGQVRSGVGVYVCVCVCLSVYLTVYLSTCMSSLCACVWLPTAAEA